MIDRESILITGGGGMLAAAFRKVLPHAHLAPRASLDITDENAVAVYLKTFNPRIILNCAAYTKVDLAETEEDKATAINGTAVGNLAKICREQNITLVHFSTDYVFDGTLRRPLQPHDPVGPQSAYGRSKLRGEQLLQENAPPDWLIIRTAWLYGPGGPNFPQAILNAARAGKPLTVVNDQIGSPTFTEDLAAATLELLDKDAQGIFHVVNDGETNWHDFAASVLDAFDVSASLAPTTSAAWKSSRPTSAIRPAYSVLDLSPFEKVVGHRPPTWRDGLQRYRRDSL